MSAAAILAAACAAAACASAQGSTGVAPAAPVEWQGTAAPLWWDSFGTANVDWANRVIELADGSILAAGFLNRADGPGGSDWDAVLRSYRADGAPVWTRRIGGEGLDAAWAATELAGGRIAVSGFSSTAGAGGNDAYLLLAEGNGEIRFEGRYGGRGDDRATDLVAAPGGGFLLVGQTDGEGAGERDLLLLRTDAAGRELWRRTHGGPGVDRGFFGAASPDGGFVIAGVTGVQGDYDFSLLKVDADGEEIWRRTVGGRGNDPTHGLILRPDGGILLLGYTRSWGARDHDLAALTFSPDGELLRHELIGGPGDDRLQYAAAGADGSVWITGYTTSFSSGGWDILVARVGPDGAFEPWLGAIDGGGDDHGSSIAVARNGDLLIGGYTNSAAGGGGPVDALVMRLRRDGIAPRTLGISIAAVPRVGDPPPPR